MKKKPTGLYVLSLLLLFMLLFENSCMAYESEETYSLTETDIKNIYEHQRDLSLNNAIITGTNYNKIITNWAFCNNAIENVTNWETLCLTLNTTMKNYFIDSGEFYGYNSTEMNDSNLWCIVSPASSIQSSTNQLRIHFIPNVCVYPQATEYNNQAGLYKTILTRFYQYNSAGTAVSTSYLSYSTAPVVTLLINNDGTWQIGYRNSNLFSGLHDTGDFYQYATSPSTEGNWLYNMNLLSLYRDNYLAVPNKQAYLPYGSSIYLTKYNENRYSLTTKTFGSGEYTPPTPTPQPTSSGDGGGITQQEIEGAIENYWGNKNDLSGEKQEEEITNAVNGIMDSISGDFSNNAIVKTLESGEAGFLSFFENGHDENWYDLKFNWPNIDLDYKWRNKDVNGLYFISGDSINISAMCREIPILGTIQTLIRTIFNFSICMMLVKQIWNLLLATLGIDNPYLYENPDEEDISFSINENAGTITKTVRKGKITRRKTI